MMKKSRLYLKDMDEVEIRNPSFIYNLKDNTYVTHVSHRRDVRFKDRQIQYDQNDKPYIEVEGVDVKA